MILTVDRKFRIDHFIAITQKLLLNDSFGDVTLHEAILAAIIRHLFNHSKQLLG